METAGFNNLDSRVTANTNQLEVTETSRRNDSQRIEQLERVVRELQSQLHNTQAQAAQAIWAATSPTAAPTGNSGTNTSNVGDLGLGTSPAPFPIAPTDRTQKRISESKNMMEAIDKVSQLHQFHAFGLSLRRICGLKYPLIHGWQDWASRRSQRPTEADVKMWSGQDWESIAEMGRDVWTILTLKITGPGQLILDHVDKLSPLCVVKASMAWFELVRETSGRFQDRKLVLSELVIDPKMVKAWGDVPEACRKWEEHVWEHEELAGAPLDDSLKTSAFLKLLPPTLKELTQTQAGLQENFEHIRDYVLNQVGRRHSGPAHLRRASEAKKDDNAMDCSRLDHDLAWDFGADDPEEDSGAADQMYYTGAKGTAKGSKGGWKGSKGGGKSGWRDARPRCYTCGAQDHFAAECPQGGKMAVKVQRE